MRTIRLFWLLTLFTFNISLGDVFEWPQFHGSQRDNVSRETGLIKQWPSGGPKLLWTAEDIGEGFSTVAVTNGLIYTTGNIGNDTVITALDLDGRVKWTAKNGPAYKRSKPGTRGTPTIDDGNVICTPGGETVGIAALNKKTGHTVWTCEGINDKPGYSSPIAFEYKGLRQIVVLMAKSVVGVNADTGRLLWRVEHVTPFDENINTPIFHKGCVFICSRTTGSRLFCLNVDGERASVEEVWKSKLLESQHGGIILLDGYLYGASRTSSLGPWVWPDFPASDFGL